MKKIISIMLALILNLNIALGYTSTILIKGVSLKVTGEEGSVVNIRSKLPEATGWEVKTNNTTVNANGEFVMPAGDVIIEAILPDALTYLLTVGNQYFDRRENKPAGEIVTVEADSSDGSFVFTDWTATGITLTAAQRMSQAITFTMPENAVTLVANYLDKSMILYGDVDDSGLVDVDDVTKLGRYLNGLEDTVNRLNSDVNQDGKIDIFDKTILQMHIGGDAGFVNLPYLGKIVIFTTPDGVYVQKYEPGETGALDINSDTKDGYTFAGWATEENGSVVYTDGANYTANDNITLYAVWSTDAYTITYNLDGGTVTGNPGTYDVTTNTITLNNPTKEGYTFKGWTGSNGNTPSTTVTIPKGSTGNKTYTANWELNTYTVTFNSNGGSGSMNAQVFTHGVAQNLTANTFTRSGYIFLGWSTDSSATAATYTNGASYTATGNTTLYAIWKINTYTVTITGTGHSSECYIEIGGTIYSSAGSYQVQVGAECNVVVDDGYGDNYIYYNNELAVGGRGPANYTFNITGDINVEMQYQAGFRKNNIYISD